jgi:NAD(P)H-hydrate epimerase
MENAGRGIVEFLMMLKPQGKVVICCGKGNNGGDGYVMARYLENQKIDVQLLVFTDAKEIKGDAKVHYHIIQKMGISIDHIIPFDANSDQDTNTDSLANVYLLLKNLTKKDWVIDGLFGTGLKGKLNPFYSAIINSINYSVNQSKAKVLAIDIPSGLDCDTGRPLDVSIIADYTCTIIALKKGFQNAEAKKYLGKIKVIDIGVPRKLLFNN